MFEKAKHPQRHKMLPLSLLRAASGRPVLIELKTGDTYNGLLSECDNWMNINLREVIHTSPDGTKFWKLATCFVRGAQIKYMRLEEDIIDKVPESSYNDRGRGRGRGRGGGSNSRGGRGENQNSRGGGVGNGRARGGSNKSRGSSRGGRGGNGRSVPGSHASGAPASGPADGAKEKKTGMSALEKARARVKAKQASSADSSNK